MRFSSAISTDGDVCTAAREAGERAREALGTGGIDLCVAFVSTGYPDKEQVSPLLHDLLGPRVLVGCSGGGIIGGGEEVEHQPALSVTLAQLPGVELTARHLADGDLPSADAPPAAWHDRFDSLRDPAGVVVLPEPFTFAADRLLTGLDYAYPGVPVVGGLASGSNHPGGHVLFLGAATHQTGAVVLALSGSIEVQTRVAQGCRPFGQVGRVTTCENNYLVAIDGQPALTFLRTQLDTLNSDDLEKAHNSPLFLGVAMDPFASKPPAPGDYLIRNIIGVDEESGMLSIGDVMSTGRAVQFHLRDRDTSAADLRTVLGREPMPRARGALLFSCLGRGQHLYGVEGHDSHVFRELVGEVPLGGFFCNGEIGPVQGATHLHGYTSSFGLFAESRA